MIKNNKKIIFIITLSILFFIISYAWFFMPSFSNTVTSTAWDGSVALSFNGGNGSLENPYLIESGSELAYLKQLLESNNQEYLNKNYKLINNINLGENEFSINNTEPFTGSINGDAYIISNGTIDNSLFNSLLNADISNINFQDITVISNESGLISKYSESSNFNNITINALYEIDLSSGTIVGTDNGSTFNNLFINYTFDTVSSDIGSILYEGNNSDIRNVLIKNSNYNKCVINNNVSTYNIVGFNNDLSIDNNEVIDNIFTDVDGYEFRIVNNKVMFFRIQIPIMNSFLVSGIFETNPTGIVGDTLYINDLERDWYYYQSLNYTESNNGIVPSGENQDIYNENTLAKVRITYSGIEVLNNVNYTGTISLEESTNKLVYYKYYPIVDGKIKIELIDNPFTNRPTGKGFNNWVLENHDAYVYLDTTTYTRYAIIDASYTNGVPDSLILDFHASWVDATYAEKTAAITWSDTFAYLENDGFMPTEFKNIACDYYDMSSYYIKKVAKYHTRFTGVTETGTVRTDYRCAVTAGCEYYVPADTFLYGVTYYELPVTPRRMVVLDTSGFNISCYDNIHPFTNRSMMGYYKQINLSNGQSFTNLYSSTGVYTESGTCTTAAGCVYYELIQSEIYNKNETYFYKVTRDTNIVYLTGIITNSWASAQNKPLTFTGIHNGVDYRGTARWNVGVDVQIYNDTTIENLYIYTTVLPENELPTSSAVGNRNLYGNYKNLKVGRGLQGTNTNRNFDAVFGGTTGTNGTALAPMKYRTIIESGKYNNIGLVRPYNGTENIYVDMIGTYGNDYDRAINNNSDLEVYYTASGTWGEE